MLLTQVSPRGAELPSLAMLWMGTPWPALCVQSSWAALSPLTPCLLSCCSPSPCPLLPAVPCSNQGGVLVAWGPWPALLAACLWWWG